MQSLYVLARVNDLLQVRVLTAMEDGVVDLHNTSSE